MRPNIVSSGLSSRSPKAPGVEHLAEGAGEERRVLAASRAGRRRGGRSRPGRARPRPGSLERAHQRLGVHAAAEDLQLHEQPAVGSAGWRRAPGRRPWLSSTAAHRSTSPRVHLEVRIALAARRSGSAAARSRQRQALLGAAVGRAPATSAVISALSSSALAPRRAAARAGRCPCVRVEAEVPQAVGGQPAAVAVARRTAPSWTR